MGADVVSATRLRRVIGVVAPHHCDARAPWAKRRSLSRGSFGSLQLLGALLYSREGILGTGVGRRHAEGVGTPLSQAPSVSSATVWAFQLLPLLSVDLVGVKLYHE